MKKALILCLLVCGLIGTVSAQEKKWNVKGSVEANYRALDGASGSASLAIGVGIHRVIRDKFSVGVDASFIGSRNVREMQVVLDFAYLCRLVDKFYYAPEVMAGSVTDLRSGRGGKTGFLTQLNPIGLEFRPCNEIGLRFSIVSLAYGKVYDKGLLSASIKPGLSVLYRF